ncbi:hypothetical protein HpCOL288_02760 [Helicobacter pylori]
MDHLKHLQQLQNIERIVLSGIVLANHKIEEVHYALTPLDLIEKIKRL